jgi:hypothetical protein
MPFTPDATSPSQHRGIFVTGWPRAPDAAALLVL